MHGSVGHELLRFHGMERRLAAVFDHFNRSTLCISLKKRPSEHCGLSVCLLQSIASYLLLLPRSYQRVVSGSPWPVNSSVNTSYIAVSRCTSGTNRCIYTDNDKTGNESERLFKV